MTTTNFKIKAGTFSLFVVLFFSLTEAVKAQMVAPSGYIQGTSLEVGINGAGGFEGVDQTISPPPAGYHARTAFAPFGFIADPAINAWASYDGDFFTPGTPENGWGIEIGTTGTTATNNYWNDVSFSGNRVDIPGSITSWNHTFNCYTSDWQGNMTTGGTNLHVKINYFLQQSDVYYTTTVSITNNTSATIPDMYYYRNLDPDNDEEVGFDFTTQNTIVSEPTSSSCELAHVSATSTVPSSQPQSYIGLAGVGANFRVDYGGFSNRDASDLWNGIGFTQTVGSTIFADEAISLAYRIQNLAPGATETFKFVVILDDASAANAVNNLLYLAYPGSASLPPAVCTPYVDTVRTCGAPVPISVGGSVVSDFSWSWTPTTGLSSSTSASIIADPPTTTTYTITGTPLSPCVAPVSMTVVVQVTPATGINPYISPVPNQCTGSAPFNLTVDSTGGLWDGTGITNDTLGTFDPGSVAPGTYMISYSTPGVCNTTDTVLVTVIGAGSATITQPSTLCIGAAPITLSAATSGGTWTGTGITSASAGTFDPNISGAGAFVITYSITGLCTSQDTVTITVDSVPDATITPHGPICVSAPAFNFTAADPGGTWTGTGITNASAGTFNPATAGLGPHIITYTIGGFCGAVDTTIINVLAIYNATITNVGLKCVNAPAFNMSAASPGGTWTGTGITNASSGTFDPATAGAGVHTITYTISGLCGTSDTALVTVIALPVISFVSDTTEGCMPTTFAFTSSTDQPGGTYSWNFGDMSTFADTSHAANPSYTYKYAGSYSVDLIYSNAIGCTSDTMEINLITIHPQPVADFSVTPFPASILTPTVNFLDQSTGLVNAWLWDFGSYGTSSQQNPTMVYADTGAFNVQLIVTDTYGCKDTADHDAYISAVYLFYAPNAFTPNGDGENDVFRVYGNDIDVDAFELTIYDRWGERVFKTTDINQGWNGARNNIGDICQQDVYVYKVVLRDYKGIRHQYIGHVTIVR